MCTETLTLRDYLRYKDPALLQTTDTVEDAVRLMERRKIHAVIACAQGRMAGLFTMGDFMRRVATNGTRPKFTTLAEVMTIDPVCALPHMVARRAFDLCVKKDISHIVVVDENRKPLGLISKEDLSRDIFKDLREKSEECHWLKKYISGENYALCT